MAFVNPTAVSENDYGWKTERDTSVPEKNYIWETD